MVSKESDSTIYAINTVTTSDPGKAYRLMLRPSTTTKQSLTVSVSDVGLLTGINYSAADQTGEIVANIFSGLANLAGIVAGHAAQLADGEELPSNEWCYAHSLDGKGAKAAHDAIAARFDSVLNTRARFGEMSRKPMSAADIAVLLRKDTLNARLLSAFAEQVTASDAAFAAASAAYAKRQQIGTTVDTSASRRFVFDVATLQDSVAVKGNADLQALANEYHLRLVVADAPARDTSARPPSIAEGTIATDKDRSDCEATGNGAPCAHIHYRMPRMRRITMSLLSNTGDTAKVLESTLTPLVSSADPVLNVAFNTQRLGSGSIKLTFGRYGNVASAEQTSDAAGLTGSAAFVKALSDSRASFQAGIKSVADAQGSLIGIRQAARAERIKEITDQKALLESEIALKGTSSNRDLLLQKQQLDAELAVLTQQEAVAQKTSALASPDATRLEIDQLKIQLELLKTQLELEKTKKELEATKTKSPEVN